MAKPATLARLEAASKGFTQVIHRGNACIVTKNPTTGRCAIDAQVGAGWHYGDNLETDTAWEADPDNNYLKMIKAGYNLRARKLFNAGNLLTWTDPASGEYVTFQPNQLQWIDGVTGSNSLISVAQAISAPTVADDQLYWQSAFGPKRHLRYVAGPVRLSKYVEIEEGGLPACPTWITNPWLELTFTLTPSSGVTMYVDGLAWDQATTKTTAAAIEFRLPSGQVIWQLEAPTAYDSSEMGNPCMGQIKLYVNKKVKYASVRFPKSWVDTAVFPIVLDPTVDYQVAASADDGTWFQKGSDYFFINTTDNTPCFGSGLGDSYFNDHVFARWTGVTIPVGATIDVSYVSIYRNNTTSPQACTLYFEDAANPSACSSWANANGRTKTTASISITAPTSGTWFNSNSINSIIQELVDSYDYSAGAAMQMLIIGLNQTSDHYCAARGYLYTGNVYGMKLHIEYTEAATAASLLEGNLIRGGILLHGILGR